MQYRQIGRSSLQVSSMGVGFWGIVGGDYWGPQDEEDTINTVHAALDAGINFFDTAEGYGDGYSEQMLGRALVGCRDKAIVATKASRGNLTPSDLRAACERSLKNLQTDYIDLYQLHWSNPNIPYEDTMKTMQALQREGKIREIGVSNFGKQDIPDMLAYGRFEANQLPYSLLWRAIEYDIQQQCMDENIAILPYSPLVQGLLTGKYKNADDVPPYRARTRLFRGDRPDSRHGLPGHEIEVFETLEAIRQICADINQSMAHVSLAWLLHQPGVTSVLAGARNVGQIDSNITAASLSLSPETLARLDAATANLKRKLGSDPDMWQSPQNSRYR